jgi:hypothetical protein
MKQISKGDPIVVRHKGGHSMTAFFVKILTADKFLVRFELAGERVVFMSTGAFEVKKSKERPMVWWSVDPHDLERVRREYARKANLKQ